MSRLLSTLLFVFATVAARAADWPTNGSQSDVNAKIALASAGDTVSIPAGTFTWGAGVTNVTVNKAIALQGAGAGVTIINIASTAPTFGSGTINLTAAGAVVKSFTVTQSGSGNTTAFATSTANGWRITDILYNSAATVGYFCYAGTYGLIDSCTINAGGGSDELVFSRGPTDSWQTANSMGTANAVYIEDCTFNNAGYVSDFNSNARGVVRFCTITGTMKVDGHGLASNTPARGVRQVEVYNNTWSGPGTFWTGIELRGGTGRVFDNQMINSAGGTAPWFQLVEYGCQNQWPNFGNVYQTPTNYPITDQIGVGQDPKTAASEPMYLWYNRKAGVDWDVIGGSGIPAGAISLYRTQTGNPSATFTMLGDIIVANRDFFKQTVGATFNGSSGVGRGTTAQMNAITPSLTGVGFWVTDQGSWRAGASGTSGILYRWSGSAWVSNYTPYTYPHPIRGSAAPQLLTATVNAAGTQLALATNVPVSIGVGGSTGFTFTAAQGALTATYLSGGGSTTLLYSLSRTPYKNEPVFFNYANPGSGIEATTGGTDLADLTNFSVTNNSTQGLPVVVSATIPAAGTSLVVVFDRACTGTGAMTLAVTSGGTAVTLGTPTGSGTATFTYGTSRTIGVGETLTRSFAGSGIAGTTGGVALAAFTAQSVTNSSTQDITAPTLLSVTIASNGTTTSQIYSENVTFDGGVTTGGTLSLSAGTPTLSYASGDTSSTLVYTASGAVNAGVTGTYNYTPGVIQDLAGNLLAAVSGLVLINASTQGSTPTPTGPPPRYPRGHKKK